MFGTLLSKTLFILAISLGFCIIGAWGVIRYFKCALEKGASYVKAITNEAGQLDLIVKPDLLVKIFWFALAVNIIAFIILMICHDIAPLNFFLMSLFTFTDGITLGVLLLNIDENIGIIVTSITALAVLLTSLTGMYSGIDFSFLGKFLFFALIGLIVISIFRLFVKISGFHRKVIAFFGILIFIGYLLYDFNNLAKAKNIAKLNNWNTALSFSVNIYLDIINLFMQILDMLSD